MSLEIEYYSQTDIGLRRQNNQDSLFINKEKNIFFLADGLGGHAGGEIASSLAIEASNRYFNENFQEFSQQTEKQPLNFLKKCIDYANTEVFKQGQRHIFLRGMGTTLVILWVYNSKIYIGHVGDSRAYLLQNQHIWQLTEDHVLHKNDIKKGIDTQNLSESFHARNTLTQGVGLLSQVQPDTLNYNLQLNDIYLICSDGLHGLVSNSKILEILQKEDLNNVPKKCIMKALSLGGLDNITIIVLKITSY